jgi:hypothetical protein
MALARHSLTVFSSGQLIHEAMLSIWFRRLVLLASVLHAYAWPTVGTSYAWPTVGTSYAWAPVGYASPQSQTTLATITFYLKPLIACHETVKLTSGRPAMHRCTYRYAHQGCGIPVYYTIYYTGIQYNKAEHAVSMVLYSQQLQMLGFNPESDVEQL